MDECHDLEQTKGDGMLVVRRRQGEWIDIAGGVDAGGLSILVTEVKGDKVRIGIAAPRDISVNRREVQKRVDSESEVES